MGLVSESLQTFESLGDNCEFGFVLRALGNHTSSLLRWGMLESVAATAYGIRTSFRDAFAFEHLVPSGGGLMVRDTTQGVAFHSAMHSVQRDGAWHFVAPEAERRRIHEQESRKLDYLRQKFDRDIASGQRIYVTKRNKGLSEADVAAIFDAVTARGHNRLLYVTLATSAHPAGTVERVDERLAHGWIDRFAAYEQADDVSLLRWQALLAATEALFARPARPTRTATQSGRAPRGLRGLFRRELAATAAPPPDPDADLVAALSDSRWFDPEVYAQRCVEALGSFDLGEAPTPSHWLGAGRAARIVPTLGFNEGFYHANNPDVAATGGFGFEHFLRWGWAEGREPLPAEDALHRRLFDPGFYAKQAGLPGDDADALWRHYLMAGLPKDAPPSPLFDPAFYGTQITRHGLEPCRGDESLVQHWLRLGAAAKVVPTPLFHERFYLVTQPDLAALPFGYLHFVLDGVRETRAPCPWFDPHFYRRQPGVPAGAGYDHFLTKGLAEGRLPSRVLAWLTKSDPSHPLDHDGYTALAAATADWTGHEPPGALLMLACLYIPEWHDPAPSIVHGLAAYLRDGAMGQPGPLFDPAIYRARAAAAGIPVPDGDSPLLHWARLGYAAKIVPTDRYDEDDYAHAYPDTIGLTGWGFEHFVMHGAAEGRAPRKRTDFDRAPAWDKTALPPCFHDWLAHDRPDAAHHPAAMPARHIQRLHHLLQSSELAEVFRRTQQVEPDIGEIDTIPELLRPPYHDPFTHLHDAILRRLPATSYDTVICIPWVRVGGADLVAGLLGRALLRVRPGERLLYLRTDNPHFERANWLPAGADVVDMSDVVQATAMPVAEHLLRVVLRGVGAKRVFNVSSRVCWTMLRSYGAHLAQTLHSYNYLFCWDQTPTGRRVGYPAEFFAATAATTTAFLTDTAHLRDELIAMYRLPEATAAKIVQLCTPAQAAIRPKAVARLVLERADPASRRLVLWAGRLDRQKRFDLVMDIARRMPDTEFRCWGSAMLDAPPDLSALPGNITMLGSFDHFDDLPLEQAGAWLFTARWEGMPTTLIELAARGVAVVASAVGGVPELIEPDCGWPVPPDADAGAYVAALQEALALPEEAARRAEALQRRVAAHYNEAGFDAALHSLLAAEIPP